MICCWPFLTRLDLLAPSWAGRLAQPAGRWLLSERADDGSAGGQPSGSRWMSHDTRCNRRCRSTSTGQSEAPAGRHADQSAARRWIEGDEQSGDGCAGNHRAALLRIGRREASRKNKIFLQGFNNKTKSWLIVRSKKRWQFRSSNNVHEVTLLTKALKTTAATEKKWPCKESHKNPREPSSQYTKLIHFVLFFCAPAWLCRIRIWVQQQKWKTSKRKRIQKNCFRHTVHAMCRVSQKEVHLNIKKILHDQNCDTESYQSEHNHAGRNYEW